MNHLSSSLKRQEISATLEDSLNGGRNTVIDVTADVNPILDFAHSAAKTLSECPRWLECRFLYDARGSALFEKICEQPEYYPTRTEAAILEEFAGEISKFTGPVTLFELGSGNSSKTRHILEAYLHEYGTARYVPVDFSRPALQRACASLIEWHPALKVVGMKGTYDCVFPYLNTLAPMLLIFLGSTLGNFYEEQDRSFWRNVAGSMKPGNYFLLGVDLIKDRYVLESAYNDEAGVSAEFTLNLFERMNRELRAGIDMARVRHAARFSSLRNRIEIFGHFLKGQRIYIRPLKKHFDISEGEFVCVEISRKFHLQQLVPHLLKFGFKTRRIFTDSRQWFALLLMERTGRSG